MNKYLREFALRLFRGGFDTLPERERRVVNHFIERAHVSRNTNREFEDERTTGQRVADRVAAFGGSWTFIIIFAATMLAWAALNSYVLARRGGAFDPYPYILLNLFLSMVAAVQAPVIMMSQNRQAAKDRLDAAHDYEVNLKAELEILSLHEKMDEFREGKWEEMVRLQQEQIRMLESLLQGRGVMVGESRLGGNEGAGSQPIEA
jgi:uncharacterized membrane protein